MRIAVYFLVTVSVALALGSPIQVPLQMQPEAGTAINTSASNHHERSVSRPNPILKEPKKLHGRFLHITDMHPDPYYNHRASTSRSCHGKDAKKKKRKAGYWGTPDVYVLSNLDVRGKPDWLCTMCTQRM